MSGETNTSAFDFQYHLKRGGSFFCESFSNLCIEDLVATEGDLSGIELCNSVFCRCNFSKGMFNEGDFDDCVFFDCNLRDTEFHLLSTQKLSFMECQMEGASFCSADVDEMILHKCHGTISLAEASAVRTTFTNCFIEGSDFRGTDLSGATFYEGSIAQALMDKKTWLTKAAFRGINITDVCLTAASDCDKADLTEAIILPFTSDLKSSAHTQEHPDMPMGKRLLGPKKPADVLPGSFNIYKRQDLAAKLYCADIEEFRRVR